MKTVVMTNQKGGVGKSAITCQLAYHFVENKELRVLVIDLDHQANTSKAIKASGLATVSARNAAQVLMEKVTSVEKANFVLVAADATNLKKMEKQAEKHNSFATNLSTFLDSVKDQFDVVIIDTNPNPDIRMIASLVVGDFVLSPIQLNQEAIDGIGELNSDIRKIKSALNSKLELIGILPNLVEPTPFQKGNFMQLVKSYSSLLIKLDPVNPGDDERFAFIPTRTAIAEAQAAGLPVWKIQKTSAKTAWIEMKPVFDVIAKRIGV